MENSKKSPIPIYSNSSYNQAQTSQDNQRTKSFVNNYDFQGNLGFRPPLNDMFSHPRGQTFQCYQNFPSSEPQGPNYSPQQMFFENPSKYISLKKYQQKMKDQTFNMTPRTTHENPDRKESIFQFKKIESNLTISKWFENLSIPHKSLVLTIVDQKLVKLLIKLQSYYQEYKYPKFSNNLYRPDEPDCQIQVKNYSNLICEKQKTKPGLSQSSNIKQTLEYQDALINAVRIIKLKDENDSISLDIDFIENQNYFMNAMKHVSNCKFLYKELKYYKDYDKNRLEASVIYNKKEDEQNSKQNGNTPYFTFEQEQVTDSKWSLGMILAHIFEKAINVQFLDYKNSLQPAAQTQFFFQDDCGYQFFQQDQFLTSYWFKQLTNQERIGILKQLTVIEQQMVTENHKKQLLMSNIMEEDQSEEDDGYLGYKKHRNAFSDDEYDLESQQQIYSQMNNEHHNNHLFSSVNNQLSRIKSKLLIQGNNITKEEQCYKFIKSISTGVKFEKIKKHDKLFLRQFYDYLNEQKAQFNLKQLFEDQDPHSEALNNKRPPPSSLNKKKRNKKNRNKNKNAQPKQEEEKKLEEKSPLKVVQDKPIFFSINEDFFNHSDSYSEQFERDSASDISQPLKGIYNGYKFKEDQARSLLTGEIRYEKQQFYEQSIDQSYEQQRAATEGSTKKKKKNNKNKKKQRKEREKRLMVEQEKGLVQIEMQELNSDGKAKPPLSQKDHSYGTLDIEQIDININVNEGDDNVEEDLETGKKINNFVIQCLQQNEAVNSAVEKQQVILLQSEEDPPHEILNDIIEQMIEEKEAQSYSKIVAQNLIQNAISQLQESGEPQSEPKKEKKNKKSKRHKKHQQSHKDPQDNNEKQEQQKKEQEKREETKEKPFIPKFDDHSSRKGKKVNFSVLREDNDEIKVPKRGSSRGSSGKDDQQHENTINQLVELFPQQYKNAQDETKKIISEITKEKSKSPEPAQLQIFKVQGKEDLSSTTGKKSQSKDKHQPKKKGKALTPQKLISQSENASLRVNSNLNQSQTTQQLKQATKKAQNGLESSGKKPDTVSENIKQSLTQVQSRQNKNHQNQMVQKFQEKVKKSQDEEVKKRPKKTQQQQPVKAVQITDQDNYESMFQKVYDQQQLKERGQQVNPDHIQQAHPQKKPPIQNIPNQVPQQQQKQSKIGNSNTSQGNNQNKKKRKSKIIQQTKETQQQKQDNYFLVRSQTPSEMLQCPLDMGKKPKSSKNQGNKNNKKKGQNQYIDQLIQFDQQSQMNNASVNQHIQTSPRLQPQLMYSNIGYQQIPPYYFSPQGHQYSNQIPSFYPQGFQFQAPQGYASPQPQTKSSPENSQNDKAWSDYQGQNFHIMMNNTQNINIKFEFPHNYYPQDQMYQIPPTMYPQFQHPSFNNPYQFQQQLQNIMPQLFGNVNPQFPQNFNQPSAHLPHFNAQSPPPQMIPQKSNSYHGSQQHSSHSQRKQGHHQHQYHFQNHVNHPNPASHHGSSLKKAHSHYQQSYQGHGMFGQKFIQNNQYDMYSFQDMVHQQLEEQMLDLKNEILGKLNQTQTERKCAQQQLTQLIRDTFFGVQIYGSMETGVAIDSSDMDLLVSGMFKNNDNVDRLLLIQQMTKLHKSLNSTSKKIGIESNSLIDTATVPVIKLVNPFFNPNRLSIQKPQQMYLSPTDKKISKDMKYLKIDITFDDKGSDQYHYQSAQTVHMGIKCCDYIKSQLQFCKEIKPLTLVLKKFLALKNLNSPFTGGLNSYGLILMIIAFFNQQFDQIYDQNGVISIGKALVQFLFYYGKIFDQNQQLIDQNVQITPHNSYAQSLTILDPLNPHNNIGKSTYNFDQIKILFSEAYNKVYEEYNKFQQYIGKNYEEIEIDDSLLYKVLDMEDRIPPTKPDYSQEENQEEMKEK